jgi:streptogramin lyase
MRSVTRATLLAFLAVLCAGAESFAADAVIRGVVTDNAGKPVRGAIVRVTLSNDKYLSRFTQKDGRYEITVPGGSYNIAADAFGYGVRRQTKDTAQAGELNFALSPKIDVTHLSGAEVEQLIPNNDQTRYLKKTCVSCHDLSWVMHHRGFTASEWKDFLPTMTQGKRGNPTFTPEQLVGISTTLEKYFGPSARYLGPDADPPTLQQLKHSQVADEVLKSTITEYRIPTGFDALAHSIQVDPYNNNDVWFSEIGFMGNKIGYFNARTEQFKEYPMSLPKASPHTMVTGKDGITWFTVNNGESGKVISVDPKTGKLTPYYMPDSKSGTHTLTMDHNGNLWFSVGGGEILTFDVSTKKFRTYKFPTEFVHAASAGSDADSGEEGGGAGTYDVSPDSKGNIWATVTGYGVLVELDPETGATKEYTAPKVPGTVVQVRGIHVDKNDRQRRHPV